MSREEINERRRYYTIVAGTFRTQVDKDDPAAQRRDWTSADGKSSGTKYERVVSSLYGKVEDVSFHDGEFGMQVYIKLDPTAEADHPIIALSTASREGEDFLKKLPNIDLAKEVRFRPYDFTGNEGDNVRGMEVMQPDDAGEFNVKIANFFRDTEKKTNINGYPNPEGDTEDYSKDDWKLYFLQCRKFLISYTKENVCPKFSAGVKPSAQSADDRFDEAIDNLDPEKMGF